MDNPKESLREGVDCEILRVRDANKGECHLTRLTIERQPELMLQLDAVLASYIAGGSYQ